MKKKWLLVNPPTGKYIRDTRCQASVNDIFAVVDRAPVDLAYIAGAITENGGECFIKDYPAEGLTVENLIVDLKKINADYIVINTTMYTYEADLNLTDICKKLNPNIITIAKGAIFFHTPEKIMQQFSNLDIGVSAEEEKTFKDLSSENLELKNINNIVYRCGEQIFCSPRLFENEFVLPPPRIDLIKHELYLRPDTKEKQATIVVGRGCHGKCIYCVAPVVGGKVARYRSARSVIDEIKEYYYKCGIRNFYFSADTFTFNKEWVLDFCNEINKLDFRISWLCTARADTISKELVIAMKGAGCWGVSVGVESGNEKIQRKIKKNLNKRIVINAIKIYKKYRIVTLLHFMIGFPWDSKETIEETIHLAKKLNGNIVEFYVVTPLPGTELYEMIEEDEKIYKKPSLQKSNQINPIMNTYYLSQSDIGMLRKKAIRAIYFNPSFYINQLKYIKSFLQFKNCLIYMLKKFKQIVFRKS